MTPLDLDGAFQAILQAVRNGEISERQIDTSVLKILEMKASVGLNRSRFVNIERAKSLVGEPEDIEFAQHVADRAITLVRDNKRVLPLRKVDVSSRSSGTQSANPQAPHRLVAIAIGEALTSTDGKEFENALKLRRPDSTMFYFDNRTNDEAAHEILKAVKNSDQVVLAIYVAHTGIRHIVVDGKLLSSYGPLGPSGKLLEQVLGIATEKTVVVDLGSPYLIVNFPEIRNYICTYAQPSTSEISAVKALFGEIQNHAKLPVTLPGIAPRGFSIPWPSMKSN